MKDAINYTYGFGCHCRNCQFKVEHQLSDDGKLMRCINGILRPEQMNENSFCSAGVPKQDINADPHHDIATAIIMLREAVAAKDAEEGYFEVKLKNGKDMRVTLYPWNDFLEVDGLCRRTRQLSDMDIIAMLQDDVHYIDEIMVWTGSEE